MMSTQSLLYFSGVTKSHLHYHLAHITDKEYSQLITEQGPCLKWKRGPFTNKKTPPSFYVIRVVFWGPYGGAPT